MTHRFPRETRVNHMASIRDNLARTQDNLEQHVLIHSDTILEAYAYMHRDRCRFCYNMHRIRNCVCLSL